MNVFDVLSERGFVKQSTDEEAIRKLFENEKVTAYVGYDPTADSLHVGHLFPTMALAHLERHGHRPIALVGGGTAMVGDPSGKTELRKMLSGEAINENLEAIKKQLATILDIEGGKSLVANNADWLMSLNYIEFLREIGRHFSVNRMLAAEAYKIRLEKGLSFIEFNYQLLQSYDFVELRRRHNCRLQMGGDDQWGNIVAGVDLSRRLDQEQVYGLTFPLQLTATGEKMGKTAGGAVWLDPNRLAPYDYYQYWVNSHDDDVERMLSFFTFLPVPEIKKVKDLEGAGLNQAKSILAYEATKIVHGDEAAKQAHRGAMAGFGGRDLSPDILPTSTVPRTGGADISSVPTSTLDDKDTEWSIIDLMVTGELAKSKGEARRLIQQGAVRLGETKVTDPYMKATADALEEGEMLLRVGKKRLHRFVRG